MVKEVARYTPKAANRHAAYLSLSLFLFALALCIASAYVPAYGGIMQLLGLLLFVPALFFAYKFVWLQYTYVIADPGDGVLCLLVEQAQGKRSSLAFRLPLYGLLRIIPAESENPRGRAYAFVASMHGGRYQYITGRVDGVNVVLKLEADDAFLSALRMAAKKVK